MYYLIHLIVCLHKPPDINFSVQNLQLLSFLSEIPSVRVVVVCRTAIPLTFIDLDCLVNIILHFSVLLHVIIVS